MKTNHKVYPKKLITVCAAAVMVFALASAAYATDVGGIQKRVQIWLHGEQTDAIMEANNGQYTLYGEDENGEMQVIGGGGGVAIDLFGNERPLTEDELREQLGDGENVEYRDDGTVWLYYQDQVIDITNQFNEDGFCYYKLNDGERDVYLTIKYQHGWSMSYDGFDSTSSFND